MDLAMTPEDRGLQQRARRFADEFLLPYELECEENGGLSAENLKAIRTATLQHGFNAINHAPEDGGQGLDLFQQILVQEQFGRATGALWDVPWRPSIPLRFGTEEQKDGYLRPACRGERRDCYAITEDAAGSDPNMVRTTAVRDGDAWVIDGEKWHVTAGDIADFILVHALVEGDPTKPTVFIVDKELPGVRLVRTPKYMHTFVFEHPIFAFEGVRVGHDRVLGDVGQGYELTKDWFVEERLMIGARTVGGATRAFEVSAEFAAGRIQFRKPIIEHQGVEFQLADMAAELMAARALLYRVGWEASRGELPRRDLHGMAAAVKLVCSETAGRVADRAVQLHGGRGYMREFPVERLFRELRVDRIWEGTSEILRVVMGNELRKRGPGLFTGWPGG
jgi:alkylation response protein AidB-like acyl-CoA dehydrogenase